MRACSLALLSISEVIAWMSADVISGVDRSTDLPIAINLFVNDTTSSARAMYTFMRNICQASKDVCDVVGGGFAGKKTRERIQKPFLFNNQTVAIAYERGAYQSASKRNRNRGRPFVDKL
jgi:hypothetical protein